MEDLSKGNITHLSPSHTTGHWLSLLPLRPSSVKCCPVDLRNLLSILTASIPSDPIISHCLHLCRSPSQSPSSCLALRSILCESDLPCPLLQLHLTPVTSFNPSYPPLPKCKDFKHLRACFMFRPLLSWSCCHWQAELSRDLPTPGSLPCTPFWPECPSSVSSCTLSLLIRGLIPGIKTMALAACQNQQEPCGSALLLATVGRPWAPSALPSNPPPQQHEGT